MLQILASGGGRDCSGGTRRDFLRASALGLGGLGFSSLFGAAPQARAAQAAYRGKSVVLLFLCGGATHIETFDPHPEAPGDARSVTGSIRTRIPSVEFGATYAGLAERADRLAVVRSYAPHGIADHAQAIKLTLTTGDAEAASLGSRFARFRGEPASGMPPAAALIEQEEVDSQYREDRDRMNVGCAPGGLGAGYAPFAPTGGGELARNMELRLDLDRLRDRRSLLASLDRLRRDADAAGRMEARETFDRQALEVLLGGGVREALDLSREEPRTRAAYDTSRFTVGWTAQGPCSLGERLLLARRLCQAGCGFVTVGFAGWDNHANANHPNVRDGMALLGRPLDQAVSAFLDDLARLGMQDDVLLVITSEFGRTPKVDQNGGRDHWPGLCPLVFAGGGLPLGQVVGRSTKQADSPATEPLGFSHLLGVLWHTLFDVGKLRLTPGLPQRLQAELERARPPAELA